MITTRERLLSKRGVGKFTLMVFGVLGAAALFAAYQIFPFYYYFFELQHHMEQVIKVADVNSDAEIRRKLLLQIHWMEIPAEDGDLKIERADGYMKISLPYTEVFYITLNGNDYTLHTFHFNARAEGNF